MTAVPDVSVVVPTHNRLNRLHSLVADLVSAGLRTDLRTEVVVVDSEEGQDSRGVTGLSTERVPVVHTLASNNLAAKRNAGVLKASGRCLVFLDDDMRIPADSGILSAHAEAHTDRAGLPPALVSGRVAFPAEWCKTDPLYAYKQSRQLAPDLSGREISPSKFVAMNCSMTKHTWSMTGGFDERFTGYGGEDLAMALRARQAGVLLTFAPEAFALHVENRLTAREHAEKMYDLGYSGVPVLLEHYPESAEFLPRSVVRSVRGIGAPLERAVGSRAVGRCAVGVGEVLRQRGRPHGALVQAVYRMSAASAVLAGARDSGRGRPRRQASTWGGTQS